VFVTLPFPFTLPFGRGTTPYLSRIWESYHRDLLSRSSRVALKVVLRRVVEGEVKVGWDMNDYRVVIVVVEQEGYKEQNVVYVQVLIGYSNEEGGKEGCRR
jgi:hypothetical protein